MCEKHFVDTDYVQSKVLYGLKKRRVLKKHIVPSIFPWSSVQSEETPRSKRQFVRKLKSTNNKCINFTEEKTEELCPEIGQEIEIQTDESKAELPMVSKEVFVSTKNTEDKETQCGVTLQNPSLLGNCRIETLKDKPEVIKYYTGLLNYLHFMFFLQCLGPAAFELNYQV